MWVRWFANMEQDDFLSSQSWTPSHLVPLYTQIVGHTVEAALICLALCFAFLFAVSVSVSVSVSVNRAVLECLTHDLSIRSSCQQHFMCDRVEHFIAYVLVSHIFVHFHVMWAVLSMLCLSVSPCLRIIYTVRCRAEHCSLGEDSAEWVRISIQSMTDYHTSCACVERMSGHCHAISHTTNSVDGCCSEWWMWWLLASQCTSYTCLDTVFKSQLPPSSLWTERVESELQCSTGLFSSLPLCFHTLPVATPSAAPLLLTTAAAATVHYSFSPRDCVWNWEIKVLNSKHQSFSQLVHSSTCQLVYEWSGVECRSLHIKTASIWLYQSPCHPLASQVSVFNVLLGERPYATKARSTRWAQQRNAMDGRSSNWLVSRVSALSSQSVTVVSVCWNM